MAARIATWHTMEEKGAYEMVETATEVRRFGWKAEDFNLKGVDGRDYSLADVKGANGTLVMFICNHCPYVKAIVGRLVDDVSVLAEKGIGAIAIMPNDTTAYPQDSIENMKAFSLAHGFPFPYVIDETQETARVYEAVCTPDFFGFNGDLELRYRGRLDASGLEPAPPGTERELLEAMTRVAESGRGPSVQVPSIGCSIKWRE